MDAHYSVCLSLYDVWDFIHGDKTNQLLQFTNELSDEYWRQQSLDDCAHNVHTDGQSHGSYQITIGKQHLHSAPTLIFFEFVHTPLLSHTQTTLLTYVLSLSIIHISRSRRHFSVSKFFQISCIWRPYTSAVPPGRTAAKSTYIAFKSRGNFYRTI